jgi:hypothetical protein
VQIDPRDGWAQHAVAHVMEMQNRSSDGISWLRVDSDAWSRDSFFQIHLWWHLALYHRERGDIDAVLTLALRAFGRGRYEETVRIIRDGRVSLRIPNWRKA